MALGPLRKLKLSEAGLVSSGCLGERQFLAMLPQQSGVHFAQSGVSVAETDLSDQMDKGYTRQVSLLFGSGRVGWC